MVKVSEIKHVWSASRAHGVLMAYTAVMVPLTDFLTGVLSALVIYAIFRKKFADLPEPGAAPKRVVEAGQPVTA
jgi:SulP family sulfate permease